MGGEGREEAFGGAFVVDQAAFEHPGLLELHMHVVGQHRARRHARQQRQQLLAVATIGGEQLTQLRHCIHQCALRLHLAELLLKLLLRFQMRMHM